MKRNILITGTSTGLGLETAILFAQKGYKVFATMRDISKSNALQEKAKVENLDIEIFQLDVTDNTSVETCINEIISKHKQIAILINEMGYGFKLFWSDKMYKSNIAFYAQTKKWQNH